MFSKKTSVFDRLGPGETTVSSTTSDNPEPLVLVRGFGTEFVRTSTPADKTVKSGASAIQKLREEVIYLRGILTNAEEISSVVKAINRSKLFICVSLAKERERMAGLFPEIDDLLYCPHDTFRSESNLPDSSTIESFPSLDDILMENKLETSLRQAMPYQSQPASCQSQSILTATSSASEAESNPILSRNALQARANRLKKKRYIEGLESACQDLRGECKKLQGVVQKQKAVIYELKNDVAYLRGVLANSSEIASVLKAVKKETRLPITSSLGGCSRKRKAPMISVPDEEEEEVEDLSDSSSALVALKKNYAMNRNAVQARAQRQKKKAYVENLKENCSVLQEQNKALQTTVNEQRAVIDELQGEIAYLRGVFANSNEIASVLRAVKKETGMPLRSSLGKRAGSKPKLHEDEAGPSHGKRLRQRDSSGRKQLNTSSQRSSSDEAAVYLVSTMGLKAKWCVIMLDMEQEGGLLREMMGERSDMLVGSGKLILTAWMNSPSSSLGAPVL
ncbi:unnamed protein product [Darwinula stevensoni]|uniref:BZIP domain-containing protein n=1 Tax=Darwinula stevensoni TaxID=69355 RepID=A0A7R8XIQ8_9CRUS|nr:unnamed protein product [Darwinula stevensoni]CAG0894075.1 unnamed protein product [Darwinula stevensoni]